MKELIFVRHAKSDWGTEFLKDIDRPLNERGYRDAYFLSEWYTKNKKKPALILASTATRALNTALIFARAFDLEPEYFQLEQNIYEAGTEKILSILKKQDKIHDSIMLFGHNPGITNTCNILSDDLFFDEIPTCGIVSYKLEIHNWSDLKAKKGTVNFYQFPKDFRNKD